jgi:multicomponent K+:H+ antiporter subunit G
MMVTIGTAATIFCLLLGSGFVLVGSIGLLKFNDGMTRLHAPTKVGTIGVGALLLASMIHSWTYGEGSIHETLIMALHIHRKSCDMPPPPPKDVKWSTLDTPDGDTL